VGYEVRRRGFIAFPITAPDPANHRQEREREREIGIFSASRYRMQANIMT